MVSKYKQGIPMTSGDVWIPSEIEKLFDGFPEKFIIVHAERGTGKTAVMANLALRSKKNVFWYSLDASDNNREVFGEYTDKLLCQVPLYEEPYLVLDNVQELISPEVWQIIMLGLMRENNGLQIIFITSGEIPEVLIPFLLERRGRILDKDVFRLTAPASVKWLVEQYEMDEQLVATVAQDTCGWALGIVSALNDLRAENKNIKQINWEDLLSRSKLTHYLDEVFWNDYEEEEQEFLMQTAVLGQFSWELCRNIFSETIRERTYQRVLQKGNFLYSQSGAEGYIYGRMFREYLLKRIEYATKKEICRNAAMYFLEQGDYRQMIQYAVMGEQIDILQGCLENRGEELLHSDREVIGSILAVLEMKGVALTIQGCKVVEQYCKRKQLIVQSFGNFQVTVDKDDRILPWRTRKGSELFAYLVDLHGESVGRSKLLNILWVDDMPDNAVSMLHNMIYNIRKELSGYQFEKILSYKNKKYRIDMDWIQWDGMRIRELVTMVEQKDLSALRQSWQEFLSYWGRYLENMDNEWIRERQDYYDEIYEKGCMMLAKQFESEGDYSLAIRYYQNILKLDPYSEKTAARILSAYGKQREWKKAKQFHKEFCRVLQDDLGLEPGAELMQVYHSYFG